MALKGRWIIGAGLEQRGGNYFIANYSSQCRPFK
jgi:hypothetical protein